MITWSEKVTLEDLLGKAIEAKDIDAAVVALFRYVLSIQGIFELDKLAKHRMSDMTGRWANETRSFYRVVASGVNADSQELYSVFGKENNLVTYLNTKEGCNRIALKLSGIVSEIRVESDREQILFDQNKYHLTSANNQNKSVNFARAGKSTKQFRILLALKRARKPLTANEIGEHVEGATSEKIRRTITDINRKTISIFDAEVVISIPGSQRPKRYKLNTDFDYA